MAKRRTQKGKRRTKKHKISKNRGKTQNRKMKGGMFGRSSKNGPRRSFYARMTGKSKAKGEENASSAPSGTGANPSNRLQRFQSKKNKDLKDKNRTIKNRRKKDGMLGALSVARMPGKAVAAKLNSMGTSVKERAKSTISGIGNSAKSTISGIGTTISETATKISADRDERLKRESDESAKLNASTAAEMEIYKERDEKATKLNNLISIKKKLIEDNDILKNPGDLDKFLDPNSIIYDKLSGTKFQELKREITHDKLIKNIGDIKGILNGAIDAVIKDPSTGLEQLPDGTVQANEEAVTEDAKEVVIAKVQQKLNEAKAGNNIDRLEAAIINAERYPNTGIQMTGASERLTQLELARAMDQQSVPKLQQAITKAQQHGVDTTAALARLTELETPARDEPVQSE